MTCAYCSSELPDEAMFCGECGRAVVAARTGAARPIVPSPLTRPVAPTGEEIVVQAESCRQCGAPMQPDDIFCPECGFVSQSVSSAFARPNDTAAIAQPMTPAPMTPAPMTPEPIEDARGEWERGFDDELEESGPAPAVQPAEPVQPAAPDEPMPPVISVPPAPVPAREAPAAFADEVESTRIVPPRRDGARFVLQFSTGESFTVFGTGLIGRNPRPEPGEFFDQFVHVSDHGRSVSKTHLEFGQEAGAFWVKDRFSGNGTTVREPDSPPVRCAPDRRYRLVRGSRVDIGEQFFIVS